VSGDATRFFVVENLEGFAEFEEVGRGERSVMVFLLLFRHGRHGGILNFWEALYAPFCRIGGGVVVGGYFIVVVRSVVSVRVG